MGFGNFGSFGETDMMLRNVNTGGAFEMTRLALGITERRKDEIVANPIIELTKQGERNPESFV
jgi:hypothetical protein